MTDGPRIGVIARAEDRGLGIQTWEVCRHLQPHRVLLIDPGTHGGTFAQHWERYTSPLHGGELKGTVDRVLWDRGGELDEATVRRFIGAVDVIYTAETFYDWRIPEWAYLADVGTVCHINPELLGWNRRGLPVTWWAPTPWRLWDLPRGTRVVPMPVATGRFEGTHDDLGDPIRFLHVAGHHAAYDRNGTTLVARAAREMRARADIVMRGQDGVLPHETRPGPQVRYIMEPDGVANYWRLYAGCDVLVMPRRYGGLCLPAQEAAAAGLALVLSDVEPNRMWPGAYVAAHVVRDVELPGGTVTLHECAPHDLAECLDGLAGDRALVDQLRHASRQWAQAHSWAALEGQWREELARACRR